MPKEIGRFSQVFVAFLDYIKFKILNATSEKVLAQYVAFMINIENKTIILAAIESSDIGSQPSRNYTSYYTYIDTITCNLVP